MARPRLEDLDRQVLLHPFTPLAEHQERGPLVITHGSGTRVTDASGRSLLDAMAGLWCVNVGYGREEIARAVSEQIRKLSFFHSFSSMANEPSILLAERLLEIAPWSMARVFFANSGSEANDTQLKLAWTYHRLRGEPGRVKVISRRRAYHGVTLGAASATGLDIVHAGFPLPLPGFIHVTPPHRWREALPDETDEAFATRLAVELDETIEREGPDTVSAFIAEPVMGAGGVLVPPASYFPAVQTVLRRHGVLMIADEVICAFGRLGRWFGGECFGIEPDLVTLAKGLTSGYVPMSACLISERVYEVFREQTDSMSFAHGYTYSGHPVAAAAALANLRIIEEEKLVQHAAHVGKKLQRQLRATVGEHPLVGEVRGMGLVAAVEIVADRETKRSFDASLGIGVRLQRLCLEEGVIVRAIGDAVAISPPLPISEIEVDEIVHAVDASITRLSQEL
jgi:L-2,4-diaminobutyrate transaminase